MNKELRVNIIRAILILCLQILVLKNINLGDGLLGQVHFFIYPLFILLLPVNMQLWIAMILAFFYGLILDLFYDTLGVHAAALVFLAYMRPITLRLLVPREGYKSNIGPSLKNYGIGWFASFCSILLLVHHLFFFSVEAFSMVYYKTILISTFLSFVASFALILVQQLIFKNKY